MCISLPGAVVSLHGPTALVHTAGVERWCNAPVRRAEARPPAGLPSKFAASPF